MNRFVVSALLPGLLLTLAACSIAPSTQATPVPATPILGPTSPSAPYASQTDDQGAVTFEVTPLNLTVPGTTLDFSISMNTHSVNLGWDLAAQSMLTTDTGLAVQGETWPVGTGHHYAGTLNFPAQTADGASLLAGAKRLTLTISGTDVAERVFVWDISQ